MLRRNFRVFMFSFMLVLVPSIFAAFYPLNNLQAVWNSGTGRLDIRWEYGGAGAVFKVYKQKLEEGVVYYQYVGETTGHSYVIENITKQEWNSMTGIAVNAVTGTMESGFMVLKKEEFKSATLSIQWQKTLGGNDHDYAYSIEQTADGGYIVAGATLSNDGDVKGNHGSYTHDMWVVKLDASGNIKWQKFLGGTSDDYAYSIQQTSDGGYIVAGYTSSNNGDVTGNHGYEDMWVVKLDGTGNIAWQKCLGGSSYDYAYSILQTSDGGYIVAGCTESDNGDVSEKRWGNDVWVVKLK
ncbi:MAG: hypothetical protein ACUVQF_05790 [Fervidobacterium sp.]|uniref:hypothetical protein n=1 Tax=Fervidobacterium sp. TaxID=1871331 RepID=UPI00404AF8F4